MLDPSKFERQLMRSFRLPSSRPDHGPKGAPQRENVPRTRQIKRGHRAATNLNAVPLKKWVRDMNIPLGNEWLKNK